MAKIERKADRHVRRRILTLAVVFCLLCFGAVVARLGYLQIANRDFYLQKALINQTKDVTIYPTRGTIYDTNGKPLAISASTEMLILNPRQLAPQSFSAMSKEEQTEYRLRNGIGSDVKAAEIKLSDDDKAAIRETRLQALCGELLEVLELEPETVTAKASKDSAYQVLRRGVEKARPTCFATLSRTISSPARCIFWRIPPAIIPTAASFPTCWAAWAPTSRA
jgi:Cell division protein FtsI/penicillin-binding protein 2